MVKDINDEGLVTTKHGKNCPILNNAKISRVRAIIKYKAEDNDLVCTECKGKNLNYEDKCNAWCCNHYEYVVDFTGGLIHSLDCKTIERMPIYDAMFKPKNYDIIDGYKKLDYSGLHSCLYCFARLN